MKIGDEVYVHGYVDEIRKDCIIIRNDGGYFGTVEDEIVNFEIKAWHKDYVEPKVTIEGNPQTDCNPTCEFYDEQCLSVDCYGCCDGYSRYKPKDEPQLVKESTEVVKDLVKDTPQTEGESR